MEHTILIMPGHGGSDAGVVAESGLKEKDFTLEMGAYVHFQLEQMSLPGLKVVMGRTDDSENPLDRRVAKARECDADLVLELHCNSFEGDARGLDAFYYRENKFTKWLANEFVRFAPDPLRRPRHTARMAAPSKYPRVNTVLESYPGDVVLVEMGFLSNPEDVALLQEPYIKGQLVMGLTSGVMGWKRVVDKPIVDYVS